MIVYSLFKLAILYIEISADKKFSRKILRKIFIKYGLSMKTLLFGFS